MFLPDESTSSLHRFTYPLKFCRSLLASQNINLVAKNVLTQEDLHSHNCYIFPPLLNHTFWPVVEELRRRAIVVMSVDDDFLTMPEWNPNWDKLGLEGQETFKDSLDIVDKLLVTTPELSKALKKEHRTVVAPNLVNLEDFQRGWKPEGYEHVVSWAGGRSHYGDLRLIENLPAKHPDSYFKFFGDLPHGVTQYYIEPGRVWVQKKPIGENVEFIDLKKLQDFLWEFRSASINVGLAPLADIPFNHSKSALKYLEYSALGITTIAQNMAPYNQIIKHGETGYLVDDWENVDLNPPDLGQAAYEFVSQHHSWQSDTGLEKWLTAFTELLL